MISQRNRDLQKAYTDFLQTHSVNKYYIRRSFVMDRIVNSPAPRFYIGTKTAERYVLGYLNGSRKIMHHRKLEMIEDLVRTYRAVLSSGECAHRYEIWERVVQSPARKFYITPARAEEIIFNHNRHRYAKTGNETRRPR